MCSATRAVVLLNEVAGRGSRLRAHEQVRREAAASGVEVRVAASTDEMQALAHRCALDGYARVIAAGGDGTVHWVLNGIARTDAALGIIPCGSGNDLAVNLGIPRDARAALQLALTGPARTIDLGKVDRLGGLSHYFGCIASFGIDSHANRIANEYAGPLRGTGLYVWSLLRALWEFAPVEIVVKHDGGEYRDSILLLAAANASSYGGGMRIAPNAGLDDGLLDLVAVLRMSRLKLLWCFPEVFSGKHLRREEVIVLRSKQLHVDAARPLDIFADGEPVGTTPVRLEVLPGALKVIAPPQ